MLNSLKLNFHQNFNPAVMEIENLRLTQHCQLLLSDYTIKILLLYVLFTFYNNLFLIYI